jgi:hypothetical protein
MNGRLRKGPGQWPMWGIRHPTANSVDPVRLDPRLGDPHNPSIDLAQSRGRGWKRVKVVRRLTVAAGSVLALILAGGAVWKVG